MARYPGTGPLDDAALARISQAVAQAESGTSAEIRVVVLTRPVIEHPFYPVLWAAAAALALPWLLLLAMPFRPLSLLAIQAGVFLALAGLLSLPAMARLTVPVQVRRAAARAAALDRFLTLGIHLTDSRTGLMILVAVPDRLVEVVADAAIQSALGPQASAAICAAVAGQGRAGDLASGIVTGVSLAGQQLAAPFPRRPHDRNELADHVIVA
ncbi:hypothetical protein [Azorhizobium sp. AG788]|uniref:hypothetical protein n=1 Tax=Azorhizobium sp. AG788 TaxID=2183897 RepID=UPI003139EE5A